MLMIQEINFEYLKPKLNSKNLKKMIRRFVEDEIIVKKNSFLPALFVVCTGIPSGVVPWF